ncbi:MAG: hypothetical protein WKF31_08905 [Thermoleophilaceae bacterium]
MTVRLTLSGEGSEPIERDKELAEPLGRGQLGDGVHTPGRDAAHRDARDGRG